MANIEHLEILKQGVEAWNIWRKDNPNIQPDLRGADLRLAYLSGAYLSGADLSWAKLSGAKLIRADLNEANLYGANLRGAYLRLAYLRGADLRGADLSKTSVFNIKYDNHMKCKGAAVTDCRGDILFARHVRDTGYIEEIKDKHRVWHTLWEISSDCGRSPVLVAAWCVFIIGLFAIFFDLAGVKSSLFTSVMTFTSFGFVKAHGHSAMEMFLICTEALLGFGMFGVLAALVINLVARKAD